MSSRNGAIGELRLAVVAAVPAIAAEESSSRPALPWRVDPARSGGGFFFEGSCHTLDILDFLLGPISDVRGFSANQAGAYRAEDLVTASMRFASGVYGDRRVVLRE